MEQPKERKVKKSNDTSSGFFTVNFEQISKNVLVLFQSTNVSSKLSIKSADRYPDFVPSVCS